MNFKKALTFAAEEITQYEILMKLSTGYLLLP